MKSVFIITLLAVAAFFHARAAPIHGMPLPTVWPQPKSATYGTDTLTLAPSFTFATQTKNDILRQALARFSKVVNETRYKHLVVSYPAPIPVAPSIGTLKALTVKVVDDEETILQLGVDESYTLTINQQGAVLTANKVWGALHGLETFSQLIQWNGTARIVRFTPITINDEPRYKWRGLLLDTARHYFPVSTIKRVIDALASIKLNVFHWHVTDAEAFPLDLVSRPLLSRLGAWSPDARYTAKDVAEIIHYAKYRGVRVVPEFDTPGHTYSWGAAYPEIILNCTNVIMKSLTPNPNVNNVCLDMTNPTTYYIVDDVMTEVSSLFLDSYLHLGGDEVAFSCVREFPRIKEWMAKNGLNPDNLADLTQYYTLKLARIVNGKNKKNMVMWQEAFYNAYRNPSMPHPLPAGTVFQVWKNEKVVDTMLDILNAGMPALFSSGWYLDQQVPSINKTTHYLWQDTFVDFYNNDPEQGLENLTPSQRNLILGGETCQWAEQIDGDSLWTRILPRAAAAAERLWSPKNFTNAAEALKRIIVTRCRFAQRGFESSGIRPDYCEVPSASAQ